MMKESMESQASLKKEIQLLKSKNKEEVAGESRNERENESLARREELEEGETTLRRRRITEMRPDRNSKQLHGPTGLKEELDPPSQQRSELKERRNEESLESTPVRRRNQMSTNSASLKEEKKQLEETRELIVSPQPLSSLRTPSKSNWVEEGQRESHNSQEEPEALKPRPSWEQKSQEPLWEEKRRRIDEEIARRLEEQEAKRSRLQASSDLMLQKTSSRAGLAKEASSSEQSFRKEDSKKALQASSFAYSPMSTEKSRGEQIKGRLKLEKRLRDEKISKLNMNQPRSKSPNRKK